MEILRNYSISKLSLQSGNSVNTLSSHDSDRVVPVVQFKTIPVDCDVVVSSNSSCTITVTFGLMPLEKAWTHLSLTYGLDSTTTIPSARMVLTLNNPWRLICHYTKETKPAAGYHYNWWKSCPTHTSLCVFPRP